MSQLPEICGFCRAKEKKSDDPRYGRRKKEGDITRKTRRL